MICIDTFVDPPAQVHQGSPERTVPEINGHDVAAPLIEGEKGRWFATCGGPLTQFAEQTVIDQLANQTRNSGTG